MHQILLLCFLLDGQGGNGHGDLLAGLDHAAVGGNALILGLELIVLVLLDLQDDVRIFSERESSRVRDAAGVALVALTAGRRAITAVNGIAVGQPHLSGLRQNRCNS